MQQTPPDYAAQSNHWQTYAQFRVQECILEWQHFGGLASVVVLIAAGFVMAVFIAAIIIVLSIGAFHS